MYIDKQYMFSNDQAITVTADSESIIDLGLTEIGEGEPIEILARVALALTGGTSLQVSVVTSASSTFNGSTTILTTAAIAEASLVAGYDFKVGRLPDDALQYIKLVYTVVGTFSAGAMVAGLVLDRDTWKALPNAS